MARKPDEPRDLALVEKLVFDGTRVTLERFTKDETRAGRTPDYKLLESAKVVGYCEVKSPRDDWLEEQLEDAPAFELRGGARSDPTFNRIGGLIEKAATQFDAVNSDHTLPNMIVFVNHADASNFGDLRETITGEFWAESGERFATMKRVSEGRLKAVRDKIDLFVWIDFKTQRIQGWFFNDANPEHVKALCELLGIDQCMIKR